MCTDPNITSQALAFEVCEEGLSLYARILGGESLQGECPSCLLSLGLVCRSNDGVLAPLTPGVAIGRMLRPMETAVEEQQNALALARASLHRAEEVYRTVYRSNSAPVHAITGADVISVTIRSVVDSCRTELLTAQPGGGRPEELLERALTSDLAALRRNVRQRTIYQHTVRSHGPTLNYIEQVTGAGAEVRTLEEVFDRLIVCDRKIAFIPDPLEERRSVALAVEHPGMIRYLVGFFEHAWERATPLRNEPTEHRPPLLTDQTRRAVLQLMVNGYTDQTIAGRLGMSTRTVATHVRKASELLGSRSRAQLAYLIAKTGVLDDATATTP